LASPEGDQPAEPVASPEDGENVTEPPVVAREPGDLEAPVEAGEQPAEPYPESGLKVEDTEGAADPTLVTEPAQVRPPATPRSGSARTFVRRRPPPVMINDSNYTDDELRRALDKLIKAKTLPAMAMVPPLHRFVIQEMVQAASHRHYEYGWKLELADEVLESMMDADDLAIRREQRRSAAADKLALIKARRDELARDWSERLFKMREEHSQRLSDLEATHRADIEQFERHWSGGEFVLEFNKPSPTLIAMRNSEHHLAVMKQFDRAVILKKESDRVEREEVDQCRARAIAAMKIEFDNLDAKQKREMECLLDNSKRHKEVNEGERDRALRPFDLLIERLNPVANPKRIPDRKKEGIFTPHVFPTPTRPLRNVHTTRGIKPYSLELPAIPIRAHIQSKKQNSQSSPVAAKGKKKDKESKAVEEPKAAPA
jgi:hypothetical protein